MIGKSRSVTSRRSTFTILININKRDDVRMYYSILSTPVMDAVGSKFVTCIFLYDFIFKLKENAVVTFLVSNYIMCNRIFLNTSTIDSRTRPVRLLSVPFTCILKYSKRRINRPGELIGNLVQSKY